MHAVIVREGSSAFISGITRRGENIARRKGEVRDLLRFPVYIFGIIKTLDFLRFSLSY